jgi:hypothetical protein
VNSITSPAHVLGQLNPDEVAHIVQASADISLTLNRDGVIQSIAFGNPDLRSPSLESWVGKNWLDVVTSESRPKIQALLQDANETSLSRFRQINLKNLAVEKHFPETLYQIYFETRAFPKKPPEAQETDLEWHRQAGITDLSVEPIVAEDGILIQFTLQEHRYSLTAIHHRFARTYFVELTLKDTDDLKLLVARVKANESTGREILEKAVIEMRSGDWIDDVASCRLLMDKRKTEVQLLAEHREVETLKSRFILNQAIRKK